MDDYRNVIRTITKCSELGISFSLDDFGTGYSSLDQLRKLPISEIKVDRSFVLDFLRDASDYKMVSSIIGLAHCFELVTVAEGIEDQQQLEKLRELGCSHAQGYFFAKPLPEAEFDHWIDSYSHQLDTVPTIYNDPA